MADNLAESSQMNEEHVRKLERHAYDALLRALRAQPDGITPFKQEVISYVRKVLPLLDEEHREGANVPHGETLSEGISQSRSTQSRSTQSRSTGEEDPASEDAAATLALNSTGEEDPASEDAAATLALNSTGEEDPASEDAAAALALLKQPVAVAPPHDASILLLEAQQARTPELWIRAPVGTPGGASGSGTLVGTAGAASGSGSGSRNLRPEPRKSRRARGED